MHSSLVFFVFHRNSFFLFLVQLFLYFVLYYYNGFFNDILSEIDLSAAEHDKFALWLHVLTDSCIFATINASCSRDFSYTCVCNNEKAFGKHNNDS